MVHHHFGIGFGSEAVAERFHARTDRLVVFDDAVVHDADFEPVACGEVGVCVRLCRSAVSRPARMREPGARLHALLAHERFQLRHAAGGAQPLQVPALEEGDPG
ncbi:hypothetical protein D3C83_45330 [compost metagenome]